MVLLAKGADRLQQILPEEMLLGTQNRAGVDVDGVRNLVLLCLLLTALAAFAPSPYIHTAKGCSVSMLKIGCNASMHDKKGRAEEQIQLDGYGLVAKESGTFVPPLLQCYSKAVTTCDCSLLFCCAGDASSTRFKAKLKTPTTALGFDQS